MSSTRADERTSVAPALRLSATAAATTWAAMLSWGDFTDLAAQFLFTLIAVGALIAVVGAVGRWRRLPGAATLMLQTVFGGAVLCLYVGDRPWPTGTFWTAIDDSFSAARTYAAPVPSTADISVQPLLAIGGLAAMLLVDLLACTLRRAPLAGLALLIVYSVPVSMLDTGIAWWVFALTALGFLMILFLQEQERVGRWGRSLDPGTSSSHRSEAVRASALLVAVGATAIAVVAPLAIPTSDLGLFGLGAGAGGDNQITIDNPLTDLRRDLRRGPDIPLLEVVTDDPSPDHLRISVLNRFSDNEFSSGDRDVPAANLADGPLPELQGVSAAVAAGARQFSYSVNVEPEFDSRWLPTQAPITSIEAAGDWRFDASTMDFLASQDDLSTTGLSYEMTAVDYDFRPEDLRVTPLASDEVSDEVTALPEQLPSIVSQLSRGVTAGARTKYDKAVVLQRWFREDGGFVYDLDDAPSAKVGTDELEAFLLEDTGRVGYCEQFATAMAVMARVLDIPSRVAVGFLTPDRTAPDTYLYSAHDLHAWPELYFPGAGWVLFDPTPGRRVRSRYLPAYTTRGTQTALPTNSPDAQTSRQPSARPTAQDPSGGATPTAEDTDAGGAGKDTGSSVPWTPVLLLLAVLTLLAALATAPKAWRAKQRARRLAGGPESVWEELRATTLDLGGAWPEHRSPRATLAVLVARFGRDGDESERPATGPDRAPEAVSALARIVHALEQKRYAPPRSGAAGGPFGDDALRCCTALMAGASPRVRRRATWLPRTVLHRRRVVEVEHTSRTGELVEHI
ncbi:MAG: transglutaminaseTgpA domain-containing protein [Nocardioides sp.]